MTASAARAAYQSPMKEVDRVLGFYGLREQPFGVTPDARFLFLSDSHKEALASLLYAIETRRGFSALVAEPGMGKTTLLFSILNDIKGHARTAFVFQPECSPSEFMRSVLDDLGIPCENQGEASLHKLLNEALLNEMQAGRRFVLVVDEAQNLEDSVLESIRLLSNFETPRAKLMHIVLAGQPQLADRLSRPELCQLKQRVCAVSWLKPLSHRDTLEYIRHRVHLGGREKPLFTTAALEEIAKRSRGIPRNINNACFLSVSLGFAKQEPVIDFPTVREATEDAGLAEPARPAPRPLWPLPGEVRPQPPVRELEFHRPLFAPRAGFEDHDEQTMRFRPAPHEGTFLKLVLIAMGFVVVPLLAIVLLGNRQIEDNLADLINGSGPPDASIVSRPAVLHPPSAPSIEKSGMTAGFDSPAAASPSDADSESNGASATEGGENSPPPPAASARKRDTQPKGISHGPQMIRVDHQQTLFELALEHYGKSNWTIVEHICIANPSLHGAYAVVHPGQRILLPDLSPEYPLLSNGGSPAMISVRQVSRYQR